MGYESRDPQERKAFYKEFQRLKEITMEQMTTEDFTIADICKLNFQFEFELDLMKTNVWIFNFGD